MQVGGPENFLDLTFKKAPDGALGAEWKVIISGISRWFWR